MQKKIFYFLVFCLLWQSFPVFAQTGVAFTKVVKEEKENFLQSLTNVSNDPAIALPLARSFESKVNAIYTSISTNDELSVVEKEKAIRSLIYFIQELSNNVMKQKMSMYEIPGAVDAYNTTLTALLYHRPLLQVLITLGIRRTELMTGSFSQYKEYSLLDDIAVYKRVAASPEFILQFLENKPGYRFADSLLLNAAMYDPGRIAFYLNSNRPGVQEKIRSTNNIYIRQIANLSGDKTATELFPFIVQLAENNISPEEIREKRMNPHDYFRLLVNTIQGEINSRPNLLNPLRNGIRKKAMSFYVNEINALHNAAEAIRFASVKDLRPQDIYYIITSCGDELYTSSYLGLYKRLMEYFKGGPADSLFEMIQYDNFRTFIRLAANYNVLGDLLQRLSPERSAAVIQRFTGGIEKDPENALEKAMDIADCFAALNAYPAISEQMQAELEANLRRCMSNQQYFGIRLYGILSDIYKLVQQEDGIEKLWATLGDYEVLKLESLQNKKGEIIQVVLFYGDEDGIGSFSNFLRLYTDKRKWEISKNDNWISIRSLTGPPLVIYANRPLDIKEEMDLKAQDSLFAYLKENSLDPVILIHRGHSYHLDKTLRRLAPSVRLAILGSCGGYNKSISIASINPGVQVIGSKKTGTMSVNDPIIDAIDETLIDKKDIEWPVIWKTLSKRFMKDEATLAMFNEYFPPSKNPGLFVLKLYDHYRKLE